MKLKCWIVIKESWECSTILGVFGSEDKAEKCLEEMAKNHACEYKVVEEEIL